MLRAQSVPTRRGSITREILARYNKQTAVHLVVFEDLDANGRLVQTIKDLPQRLTRILSNVGNPIGFEKRVITLIYIEKHQTALGEVAYDVCQRFLK